MQKERLTYIQLFQHERQHDDDDGSTRQVLVQEQAANCAKMHPCDSIFIHVI
jgi:hypothetical protein